MKKETRRSFLKKAGTIVGTTVGATTISTIVAGIQIKSNQMIPYRYEGGKLVRVKGIESIQKGDFFKVKHPESGNWVGHENGGTIYEATDDSTWHNNSKRYGCTVIWHNPRDPDIRKKLLLS